MSFIYYNMLFFVVNEGKNPWINFLYTGLLEVPALLVATVLVKYCRRKMLYLVLYSISAVAAGAILFTTAGESVRYRSRQDSWHLAQLMGEVFVVEGYHLIILWSLVESRSFGGSNRSRDRGAHRRECLGAILSEFVIQKLLVPGG